MSVTGVHAQNRSEEAFTTVNALIQDGLKKNFTEIQKESVNLTGSQRLTLHRLNENKMGLPLALNLLVGFGLGSIIQGDVVGGIGGIVGDAAGLTFVFIGLFQSINYYTTVIGEPEGSDGMTMIITGSAILGVSRLFQIIKPITYSGSYNKMLNKALNPVNYTFEISPSIDINGNIGVIAKFSY